MILNIRVKTVLKSEETMLVMGKICCSLKSTLPQSPVPGEEMWAPNCSPWGRYVCCIPNLSGRPAVMLSGTAMPLQLVYVIVYWWEDSPEGAPGASGCPDQGCSLFTITPRLQTSGQNPVEDRKCKVREKKGDGERSKRLGDEGKEERFAEMWSFIYYQ